MASSAFRSRLLTVIFSFKYRSWMSWARITKVLASLFWALMNSSAVIPPSFQFFGIVEIELFHVFDFHAHEGLIELGESFSDDGHEVAAIAFFAIDFNIYEGHIAFFSAALFDGFTGGMSFS